MMQEIGNFGVILYENIADFMINDAINWKLGSDWRYDKNLVKIWQVSGKYGENQVRSF